MTKKKNKNVKQKEKQKKGGEIKIEEQGEEDTREGERNEQQILAREEQGSIEVQKEVEEESEEKNSSLKGDTKNDNDSNTMIEDNNKENSNNIVNDDNSENNNNNNNNNNNDVDEGNNELSKNSLQEGSNIIVMPQEKITDTQEIERNPGQTENQDKQQQQQQQQEEQQQEEQQQEEEKENEQIKNEQQENKEQIENKEQKENEELKKNERNQKSSETQQINEHDIQEQSKEEKQSNDDDDEQKTNVNNSKIDSTEKDKTNELEETLKVEQEKYAKLLKEYENHKSKVEQWQDKVKKMTKQNTQQIKQLKQKMKEKQNEEEFRKKGLQNATVLSRVRIDNELWCLVQYVLLKEDSTANPSGNEGNADSPVTTGQTNHQSSGKELETPLIIDNQTKREWILQEELENYLTSLNEEHLPIPIQDEVENSIKQQMDQEVGKWTRQYEEKEEELKKYKARAHAALKKSKESYTELESQSSKEIEKYKKEIEELNKKISDLQISNKELDTQVQSLLDVQQSAVRLGEELDQVTLQKEELEEKLKHTENQLEEATVSFKNERDELIKKHSIELEKLEQRKSSLEQQLRKEIQVARDRGRKTIDDKERDIAILQKKVADLSNELQRKTQEYQTEIQDIKQREESALKQIENLQHSTNPTEKQSTSDNNQVSIQLLPASDTQVNKQVKRDNESQILRAALSFVGDDDNPTELENGNHHQSSAIMNATSETSPEMDKILQFAQLQASRDSEIQTYKTKVKVLERELKEKEKTEKFLREIEEKLRKEIHSLQSLHEKGTPNLEYLKNILIKFLEATDLTVKQRLFSVISTILAIDDSEQQRLSDKLELPKKSNPSAGGGLFSLFAPSASSSPSKNHS